MAFGAFLKELDVRKQKALAMGGEKKLARRKAGACAVRATMLE